MRSSSQPAIIRTAEEMRRYVREVKARPDRIALVPTMGYLHEGHLSLVRRARELAEHVVVSIYVNPTQFGPGEDLERYPRDLGGDLAKLAPLGVDAVFVPDDREMYPPGFSTVVRVEGLTRGLCGRSRPTHFEGVTTVVAKLLNVVEPDFAVFGEKDYQQLVVIRRMVRDLDIPVEIVGSATVREPDGLAMSSRNAYLSPAQRTAATALNRALRAVRARFRGGERSARALLELARGIIAAEPEVMIDYLELVDPEDLRPLPEDDGDRLPERVHMAVAAKLGTTRLIDNLRISEDP